MPRRRRHRRILLRTNSHNGRCRTQLHGYKITFTHSESDRVNKLYVENCFLVGRRMATVLLRSFGAG